MKKIVSSIFILFASLMTSNVFAVPMQYQINFSGAVAGTGSFVWDYDTQLMSNMSWNIGSYAGGVDESTYSWGAEVFGGTQSQFLFEIMTLEDVHPVACSETSGCGVLISNTYGDFDTAYFQVTSDNLRRYSFMIGEQFAASGLFSTSLVGPASVPAPTSLALLGLGLIGFSFARRKEI